MGGGASQLRCTIVSPTSPGGTPLTETRPARAIVQHRALMQRINKILAKSDRRLLRTRAKLVDIGIAPWTVIDAGTRLAIDYHHTLDAIAAETGTLKPFERIALE